VSINNISLDVVRVGVVHTFTTTAFVRVNLYNSRRIRHLTQNFKFSDSKAVMIIPTLALSEVYCCYFISFCIFHVCCDRKTGLTQQYFSCLANEVVSSL